MSDSHSSKSQNPSDTSVRQAVESELSADEVLAYLLAHRDFYQRYPEAFAGLQLAHQVTDSASLLEKQIEVLRDRNRELTNKLKVMVATVRKNESLSLALHYLAIRLLSVLVDGAKLEFRDRKISAIKQVCGEVFHERFPDTKIFLHWFAEFINDNSDNTLSIIRRDDQRIAGLLHRVFSTGKPDCSRLTKPQCIVLLPQLNSSVASTAVVPLQQPKFGSKIGLLVLYSSDANKFSPGKGTMFLVQLAQLIEHSCG